MQVVDDDDFIGFQTIYCLGTTISLVPPSYFFI